MTDHKTTGNTDSNAKRDSCLGTNRSTVEALPAGRGLRSSAFLLRAAASVAWCVGACAALHVSHNYDRRVASTCGASFLAAMKPKWALDALGTVLGYSENSSLGWEAPTE